MPANIDLSAVIPSLPNAVWVKDQIKAVLRNLLLNAIEAMPRGGRLSIQATESESQLHFSISDTGIGMDEDFIHHRLFRPHQTTKSKGLGIGMYQSKEMVAAHRGRILVSSQPNHGTCFDVFLPLSPVEVTKLGEAVREAQLQAGVAKTDHFELLKLQAATQM
jgi:hypothetical protein